MSKGCPRHIEGIHTQIGRKPSVYDFLSLVLPVRDIPEWSQSLSLHPRLTRSKSRDDLIRAQLAKFVIVVSGISFLRVIVHICQRFHITH